INPYQETRFLASKKISEIHKEFDKLESGKETDKKEQIAGRIFSIRTHGGVAFVDIKDMTGKLQLMFRKDKGADAFEFLENYLDDGDIIGITGQVVKTRRGELSLFVKEIKLLSKALRPIPHEWHGVKDVEIRYRQRYLDLAINSNVRKKFEQISKMTQGMRAYLDSHEFLEVSTPELQPIYGGAFALPFKTHHNYLKQEMFLRVAPELYLKRLLVGGFERVYEIGACFRNESVDTKHNPEFVQLEAYQAYVDFEDIMKLTEHIVSAGIKAALGKTELEYQGHLINVKPSWKRMSMLDAIKKYGKLDLSSMGDKEILELAKEHNIKAIRIGDVIEDLFSLFAEPKLIQPTFITEFPSDISPLAKKFPERPKFAQRFEFYIAGTECGNGFSELNNPIEQFARFKEEEELRKKKKIKELEYMPMDKDYVRALEYGMPPAGGVGIGIGRVARLITNSPSLKEAILFPTVASVDKIKTVAELHPDMLKLFE
ncbi:MAG: lysine--tRNA ligase, partial [Candidatus Altiarchaeota archaeon]|nr:lysine--tRNA ligase [Candidatus Altiarchaeota archaeon]